MGHICREMVATHPETAVAKATCRYRPSPYCAQEVSFGHFRFVKALAVSNYEFLPVVVFEALVSSNVRASSCTPLGMQLVLIAPHINREPNGSGLNK